MPSTNLEIQSILSREFGNVTSTTPSNLYVGLIIADTWVSGTSYSSGQYVTGTAFSSSNNLIYICQTAGITGDTEPIWNQVEGSITNDGSVTWIESSLEFAAGNFTGAEPFSSGYGRVQIPNNTAYWIYSNNQAQNVQNISFPQSTGAWGSIAGFMISDSPSGGNYRIWGLLPQLQGVTGSGVDVLFPPGNLVITIASSVALTLGSGIVKVESTDDSVTVLNGLGPIVNLQVSTSSSNILVQEAYGPEGSSCSPGAEYELSGDTLTSLDETNLSYSFTTPSSGRVRVQASFQYFLETDEGDAQFFVCFISHGTSSLVSSIIPMVEMSDSAFQGGFVTYDTLASVTPDTLVQWDFSAWVSNDPETAYIYAGEGLTTEDSPPFLVTIYSA